MTMFVCRECVKPEGQWLFMLLVSYGSCELCGKTTECIDAHDYSVVKEIEGESSIP